MNIQSGKYLTFALGNEAYGIPILKVREIIGMMDIVHVPKSPLFIKGVVNLRGKIIPIMDLRLKFGLGERAYNERTCIIVVEIQIAQMLRQMGIIVDTVSEVVNITSEQIEPPPQYGELMNNGFLLGIGKVSEKVIMLLNMDEVLDAEEITLLNDIKGSTADN